MKRDFAIEHIRDTDRHRTHFVSNVPAEHASLIRQAAITTRMAISIGDAKDNLGRPVEGDIGIFHTGTHDLGAFWREYHRLKQASKSILTCPNCHHAISVCGCIETVPGQ